MRADCPFVLRGSAGLSAARTLQASRMRLASGAQQQRHTKTGQQNTAAVYRTEEMHAEGGDRSHGKEHAAIPLRLPGRMSPCRDSDEESAMEQRRCDNADCSADSRCVCR